MPGFPVEAGIVVPQVLPSRHDDLPVDLTSATPADVHMGDFVSASVMIRTP